MLTALVFILVLSLLIFVHEFGHFLAAKLVGIKVEEFAFGLPFTKPIYQTKKKDLKISIYPIIFGGFVKLLGEEQKEIKGKPPKNAFCAKSPLARSFVVVSGVLMNFFLAVITVAVILAHGIYVPTKNISIQQVVPNTPAATANLQEGDIIEKVADQKIERYQDLTNTIESYKGKTTTLQIKRKDQLIKVNVTPRTNYPKNEGPLGVVISNLSRQTYTWYQIPIQAFAQTFSLCILITQTFFIMLKDIILTGSIPKDIAGPVGVAQLTGQAVQMGYLAVLQLLALLSVNLVIFNILPFPALDGGRLLFIVLEVIVGKKIAPKIENYTNMAGMFLLIFFVILVTFNDLDRIFNFKKILDPIISRF